MSASELFIFVVIMIVLIILAVSIHLGAMRGMLALMPRMRDLKNFRVGLLILLAIFAHMVEIAFFAWGLDFLLKAGDYGQLTGAYELNFQNNYYYSAIVYTAVGFGDITPTGPLRLFAAIEAITGLVLIAWTASAVFVAMQRYWTERTGDPEKELTGSAGD